MNAAQRIVGLNATTLARLVLLAMAACLLVPLVPRHALAEQSRQQPLSEQLDAIIARGLREHAYAGAVLLVARDGKVLHEKAYGYSRKYAAGQVPLASPRPMTVETLFDVASLTKVFATTFGAMLLVDRGDLDLDAPVARYLPLFDRAPQRTITIRHLLSHRSGLPAWRPVYCHAANPAESAAYIATVPLQSPAGAEYRYSDLNFMLLGYVIEAVSGLPLDRFLAERLYAPLGLANTTFHPEKLAGVGVAATSAGNPVERRMAMSGNFGDPCAADARVFDRWRRRVLAGEVNDGNAYYAHQGVAGHAGLFATAADLKVLTDVLLGSGSYQGESLIGVATVKTFLTADDLGNGLGWQLRPAVIKAPGAPAGSFGHTGFTGCNVLVVPQRGIVLIFLSNRQHEGLTAAGSYPQLDELRGELARAVLER